MSKIVLGEHSWRSDEVSVVPVSGKVPTLTEAESWQDSASSQHCIILPGQPGTLDTFPIALTSSPVRPGTLDTFAITRSPAPVRPGSPHPNPSMRIRAELIPALRLSGNKSRAWLGAGGLVKRRRRSHEVWLLARFPRKERCGRSVCAPGGAAGPLRAARAPDARPGSRRWERWPPAATQWRYLGQRAAATAASCPQRHRLSRGPAPSDTLPGAWSPGSAGERPAPSSLGIADAAMLSCTGFNPPGRTRGHESPGKGRTRPGVYVMQETPGSGENSTGYKSNLRGHRAPLVPERPPSHSPTHSRIRSNLTPGE